MTKPSESPWYGVWATKEDYTGHWHCLSNGETLRTTLTEARRTADVLNDFAGQREDSTGWRYDVRPHLSEYEAGRVAGLDEAVVVAETVQREAALIGQLAEANGAERVKLRIQRTLLPFDVSWHCVCGRSIRELVRGPQHDRHCPWWAPDAGKTSEAKCTCPNGAPEPDDRCPIHGSKPATCATCIACGGPIRGIVCPACAAADKAEVK